jgi:large subunit ribosomal protein L17
MRHQLRGRKLNRTSSHRKAMLANMAVALVTHEQIKTTLPKAKELRRYIEKLVTISRVPTLASRRRLIADLRDTLAADKMISVLGPRYQERPGGYTRIVKAGFRYGDVAPIAYIEFVDRNIDAKGNLLVKNIKSDKSTNEKKKLVKTKAESDVNEKKTSVKAKKTSETETENK